jgi:hypothetical protein
MDCLFDFFKLGKGANKERRGTVAIYWANQKHANNCARIFQKCKKPHKAAFWL